jgi:hypothetical protein
MPGEVFDLNTVNRFVLHKQHLADSRTPESVVEVARHIGGLHNTSPSTPHLSLFARVPGFSRDMLDDEMYVHRSLVRIRCMRDTMHVLPRDMLPVAFMAMQQFTGINAERYLRHRGVSDEEYEAVSGKVVALLADGGRTVAEIKKAVGPVTNMPAVLTMMCDRGNLVRGETPNWRSNAYKYHLFSEYLPGLSLESIDEHDAILQLARSYLSAFGPVTPDDFAWWSGIGKTKVRSALTELPIANIGIRGLEGEFVLLQDDLRALKETECGNGTVVNLLPWLDPYVMGYKIRGRYLSGDSYDLVFDRSGNSTNTIVIDGRLSGVWDTGNESGPLMKYLFFDDVDGASRKKIVAEAARLGQFIYGRPVKVRECRSMQPLPERTPGAAMSPLKGQ